MSPEDFGDLEGFEGFEGLDEPAGESVDQRYLIYAPNGTVNTGSVYGGQRVQNSGTATDGGGRRVEAHEGPIPATEILEARTGFAEPGWFRSALAELDSGVLFLTGEPGSGRRTAALNLLHRHSGSSLDLRALDNGVDLAGWRPTGTGTRGYVVYGLLPQHHLGPAVLANLRAELKKVHARMVIVLPHEPTTVRGLAKDLHVAPVHCDPPAPRAVFDARLKAAVPDPSRREQLLAGLEPGLLEGLLTPDLMPGQVAELVTEVTEAGEDGPDPDALRERLSFLAQDEVPELLERLREDPDGLAFLLATSVFEGLDHRIVREEAERLTELAAGRLDAVVRGDGEDDGKGEAGGRDRPNPKFVFRRSLDDLLRLVRAECGAPEIRRGGSYNYTVEPIRFTRHRQGESVLRHLWRQYGGSSVLLTEWMETTSGRETALAEPVGRVMGMAAGWGGGRRALQHITELAKSEHAHSRTAAAYALGIAAQDLVLASEIKYRLTGWSYQGSWRLRWTVAYACGTDFGLARPDVALTLLRHCYRGQQEDERRVATEVGRAVARLFVGGNQDTVFRSVARWAERSGGDAELAALVLPGLLRQDAAWFGRQLVMVGEHGETVLALVRRLLDDDHHSDAMRNAVLAWCVTAGWDEELRPGLETLLIALAQGMRHGVLALFVEIDRYEGPVPAGRHIARHALDSWRRGGTGQQPPAHADGVLG